MKENLTPGTPGPRRSGGRKGKKSSDWRISDSLWRDSVGRRLIDSATVKRPIRPPRPLPTPPTPERSWLDRAAIRVYQWVWDRVRWVGGVSRYQMGAP